MKVSLQKKISRFDISVGLFLFLVISIAIFRIPPHAEIIVKVALYFVYALFLFEALKILVLTIFHIQFAYLKFRNPTSRKTKFRKPPALLLLELSTLLPKKQRQNLEQEISDMLLEYYEALSEKKIWRARIIVAFYYIGLGWSVVMWISDKVKEIIGTIPKKN